MARQKGLIKYVGKIGDVPHFKIKGEKDYFAWLVGGPTAEQILTTDEFKWTRENMGEFADCASVGKAIRTAFSPLKHMFRNVSEITYAFGRRLLGAGCVSEIVT